MSKTGPVSSAGAAPAVGRASFPHSHTSRHLGAALTSFRFELVIVWRMHIDEDGKVLPKLDLLTQVPQRGRQASGLCSLSAQQGHPLISPGSHGKNQKLEICVLFMSA